MATESDNITERMKEHILDITRRIYTTVLEHRFTGDRENEALLVEAIFNELLDSFVASAEIFVDMQREMGGRRLIDVLKPSVQ